MYNEEENLMKKLQAEQKIGGANYPAAGVASMENTRSQLLRRLRDADRDSETAKRALRIIEAHPEFEDFAWLMRSGLI